MTLSRSLTYLPRLAPEALHGWLGQWVRTLEPHTAADPIAILALGLGALGHRVRAVHGPGGEPLNQLLVLIGNQRARVDLAWRLVDQLFGLDWRKTEDPKKRRIWAGQETLPPIRFWDPLAQWWLTGYGSVLVSSSQEEVLARLTKSGAILSRFPPRTLLLGVGEGRPLGKADELQGDLDVTATEVLRIVAELEESVAFAEGGQPVRLSSKGEALKNEMDAELRKSRNAGKIIDHMVALGERHVLRLAGLYAVVDRSSEIKPDHLLAALAVWDHHEETLRELFGHQTGNKKQDAILRSLRERHPAGLSTSEINSTVLQGNSRGGAGPILEELEHAGLIYSQEESANGRGKRPAHRWFLTQTPDVGMKHSYLGIAQAILRQNR